MKHTDYKVKDNSEAEEFMRYIIDFYGTDGIYPHWTNDYIIKHTKRYMEIYPDLYPDSLERERCRDYLFYTSGQLYKLKELEHRGHIEKTILKRRQKDRKIKINNIL